eukprot:GHVP01061692.1.p1 GENE.GHVP01061692.1~~GHVP01061692.1.p1  ORF type:complete len:165 (-),score=36.57 GHVP01061692.1:503-997(-)
MLLRIIMGSLFIGNVFAENEEPHDLAEQIIKGKEKTMTEKAEDEAEHRNVEDKLSSLVNPDFVEYLHTTVDVLNRIKDFNRLHGDKDPALGSFKQVLVISKSILIELLKKKAEERAVRSMITLVLVLKKFIRCMNGDKGAQADGGDNDDIPKDFLRVLEDILVK